jgi:hypothetical protein
MAAFRGPKSFPLREKMSLRRHVETFNFYFQQQNLALSTPRGGHVLCKRDATKQIELGPNRKLLLRMTAYAYVLTVRMCPALAFSKATSKLTKERANRKVGKSAHKHGQWSGLPLCKVALWALN